MLAVHHVALQVVDLQETIDFYTTVFQFEYEKTIEYPTATVKFLKHADTPVKLELLLYHGEQPASTLSGWHHLCFETTQFDAVIDALQASRFAQEMSITTNDAQLRAVMLRGSAREQIQLLERKA